GAELWPLDLANHRLRPPKGGDIALSGHDFFVLRALLASQGTPVSRRQIISAIGEDYLHFDQRRLDTQMSRLKKKVRDACDLDLPIKSVHGVGYIFSGRAMVKEG
ncbi:MAG: winged helix-turn-helix domain-containing protein, partial [Rhodoferax sp.]|nr:winged helix-turn-helix domain-containing protein [Rhodoferax sp.]